MGYFVAFKKKDNLEEGWLKSIILSAALLHGVSSEIALGAMDSNPAKQLGIKIINVSKTSDGRPKYDIMVNKDNIHKAKAFIKRLGLNVQGQG